MRKRHNPQKQRADHAQKYIYTFPQAELNAVIDLTAHGMTKALEDFKTRPDITKDEIEQEIIQSCKELEKTPNFTNDHAFYTRIAKQWYTYGYMTMQNIYRKDTEEYRKERRKFEEWGWDACYQFAHKKIVENMLVGGASHG